MNNMSMCGLSRFAIVWMVVLCSITPSSEAVDPVKVFIVAGESNMLGYGKVEVGRVPGTYVSGQSPLITVGGDGSLRQLVNSNPGKYGFGGTMPLVDASGKWALSTNVTEYARMIVNVGTDAPYYVKGAHTAGVDTLTAAGAAKLPTLTYGKLDGGGQIGPDFGFGAVLGKGMQDSDVLIIKVASGGSDLRNTWRSPLAVAKRGGVVGPEWTSMTATVTSALSTLGTNFPQYAGRSYQIAGFGWHQGWNDNSTAGAAEYEANMADFIRDVKSLYGANTPFVIGSAGFGGMTQSGNIATINTAQLAMMNGTKYPEFAGSVATVDTRPFWRDASISPSAFNYHWNHNGQTIWDIGSGMGEAYLTLPAAQAFIPEPSALAVLGLGGLLVGRRCRRD